MKNDIMIFVPAALINCFCCSFIWHVFPYLLFYCIRFQKLDGMSFSFHSRKWLALAWFYALCMLIFSKLQCTCTVSKWEKYIPETKNSYVTKFFLTYHTDHTIRMMILHLSYYFWLIAPQYKSTFLYHSAW